MNVHVSDLKAMARCSHDPLLFLELVDFLNETLDEPGILFESDSASKMQMIGYRFVDYQNSNYNGKWPLVSIAPQMNNISIYIMAVNEAGYLVPQYAHFFGKSNCGKSCIRVKHMSDKKYEGLYELLNQIKVKSNKE